jgi:hypothetical protein
VSVRRPQGVCSCGSAWIAWIRRRGLPRRRSRIRASWTGPRCLPRRGRNAPTLRAGLQEARAPRPDRASSQAASDQRASGRLDPEWTHAPGFRGRHVAAPDATGRCYVWPRVIPVSSAPGCLCRYLSQTGRDGSNPVAPLKDPCLSVWHRTGPRVLASDLLDTSLMLRVTSVPA